MKFFLSFLLILGLMFHCLVADLYFDPARVGTSAAMIRTGYIGGFNLYASALFENPASLYRTDRVSGSLFHTTLMDEVVYQNVAFSYRLKYGVIGIGFMQSGVDGLTHTDWIDGGVSVTGTSYSYANNFLKATYQYSFSDQFHLGVNFTNYQLSMDTVSAKGSNMDFGVVFENQWAGFSFVMNNFLPSKEIVFADSDNTFSGQNSSDGKKEILPSSWVLSGQTYWDSWSFLAQIKSLTYYSVLLKSASISYDPISLPFLSLSVGYSEFHEVQRIEEHVNSSFVFSSITYGVGFYMFGANFDYAFEKGDHVNPQFQNRHYFSLNFSL